ncbi:hypothetical protein LINPERPRIM_LOCUS36029 [Linum perenne]
MTLQQAPVSGNIPQMPKSLVGHFPVEEVGDGAGPSPKGLNGGIVNWSRAGRAETMEKKRRLSARKRAKAEFVWEAITLYWSSKRG